MDEEDLMDIDIDGLSDEVGDIDPDDLFNMVDDDPNLEEEVVFTAPKVKLKKKKKKRKRANNNKGKEEEVEFDSLDDALGNGGDVRSIMDEIQGTGGENEEAEVEFDSSEERNRAKKEMALRKLDSKMKRGTKKKAPITKKKQRTKRTPPPPSSNKRGVNAFPNRKDLLGLMTYIHSSGYTTICNGSGGDTLTELQRQQVDDKAFAMANLFSKRLNNFVTQTEEAFRKLVLGNNPSASGQLQLSNLFSALKKYKRFVIPGGKEKEKPEAFCPFTQSKVDHETSVRMVIIPDEEGSVPVVFYTDIRVAGLLRTLHTLYHFGAYFDLDMEKAIINAKKTLEDDTEDADVVWDAVFNPADSIPEKKSAQQPGTRQVGLKQDLLINLCKAVRSLVGDESF